MSIFILSSTYFDLAAPLFLISFIFLYGSRLYGNGKSRTQWSKHYRDLKLLAPYLRSQDKAEGLHSLRIFLAVLLFIVLGRGVNLLSPLLFRSVWKSLTDPAGHEGPFPWLEITGYIFLRYFVQDSFSYIKWSLTRRLENQVKDRIAVAAYNKLMSLSADYHDKKSSISAWTTVQNSGGAVSKFGSTVCFEIVPNILDLILGGIAFGSVCGARSMWIMMTTMGLYLLATIKVSRLDLDGDIDEQWEDALRRKQEISSQTISNWWLVSLFGRIEDEKRLFANAVEIHTTIDTKFDDFAFMGHHAKHSISSLGVLLISFVIGREIWSGHRPAEDMMMLYDLWGRFTGPVLSFLNWKRKMKTFFMETERLIDILSQSPTIMDRKGAQDLQHKTGRIKFQNVYFSYKDREITALKDISFEIEGGKTVAIVGKSGGGKSTLLKLLLRSYDTTSGSVAIDEQDIKNVRRDSLLSHIGIVPQSIGAFSYSILRNLRYAKANATVEECEEVCRVVGLHDKISTFKKGYNEDIGEGGSRLSGGELQRLAIARMLLRNPKIVLLDEAFSNLDSQTEASIQSYLRLWGVGRTVVTVAHRLGSIAQADLILVVQDGRIVEKGTQEELLDIGGVFNELWKLQKLPS